LRDGQTVFTILVLFSSLQNFSTCEMFLYTVNPREKNGGFRFPKLTWPQNLFVPCEVSFWISGVDTPWEPQCRGFWKLGIFQRLALWSLLLCQLTPQIARMYAYFPLQLLFCPVCEINRKLLTFSRWEIPGHILKCLNTGLCRTVVIVI
jgi:hypothetical protein